MADLKASPLPQAAGEIAQYDFDFAPQLDTGVSVVSAVATHLPPSGASGTIVIGAPVDNVVPVKLTMPSNAVEGYHRLDIRATTNNVLTPVIHLSIPVITRYGAI